MKFEETAGKYRQCKNPKCDCVDFTAHSVSGETFYVCVGCGKYNTFDELMGNDEIVRPRLLKQKWLGMIS